MTAKASSLWMQGHQELGITLLDEMLSIARSLRHPPSLAAALAYQMFFSLYDRDWHRLFAYADEVYTLSQAEGFAMWAANAGLHRGRARMALGQLEAGAAEDGPNGVPCSARPGWGLSKARLPAWLARRCIYPGARGRPLVVSNEGERRAETGLVRVMMPEIYRTRGDILRDLGRVIEANEVYPQAVACARAQNARSLDCAR